MQLKRDLCINMGKIKVRPSAFPQSAKMSKTPLIRAGAGRLYKVSGRCLSLAHYIKIGKDTSIVHGVIGAEACVAD